MSEYLTTYAKFRPTMCDALGLGLPDRQDWLVAPVSHNRDSDVLTVSNWHVVKEDLEASDTGEDLEVHRFGHWGPGWFEIILVRPGSECAKKAEQWACSLADYPVACESDFSERELAEAEEVWQNCYDDNDRIKFIEKHRDDFEFDSFVDMLRCARGVFFGGSASALLS